MRRYRSARLARPKGDRPASASSRSPGKMAARAEKCGKARKSAEKNKKPSAPATAPNKKDRAAALADYDQLSAIMSKYNLSAPPPPPRSPRAPPPSAPSSHPGGDCRINRKERRDRKEMTLSSRVFAFFVFFAVNSLSSLQPVPSLTRRPRPFRTPHSAFRTRASAFFQKQTLHRAAYGV